MIPVRKQPEPPNFQRDVRTPGMAYLARCPHPNSKQFNKHNFWTAIHADLYHFYSGICAYTGAWFSNTETSVDHFIPKSLNPGLAYEWNNYRLTTTKMNNIKSDTTGIVDPFEIQLGWFTLEFPSCLIKPNNILDEIEYNQIYYTICVLRLNSDDTCVGSRVGIIQSYIDGIMPFDFLKEKYPFIAYELERQNLVETIGDLFIGLGH